jgi:hypothetical protein
VKEDALFRKTTICASEKDRQRPGKNDITETTMDVTDSEGLRALYSVKWQYPNVTPVLIFDSVFRDGAGPKLGLDLAVKFRNRKEQKNIIIPKVLPALPPGASESKAKFDRVIRQINETKNVEYKEELKYSDALLIFMLDMSGHLFGPKSKTKARDPQIFLADKSPRSCSILSPVSKTISIYFMSEGSCDVKLINGDQAMKNVYRSKDPEPMEDIDARLKSWTNNPQSTEELEKWKENKVTIHEQTFGRGHFFILSPQESWTQNERCILVSHGPMVALKWLVSI